jgi:hypothetical protein
LNYLIARCAEFGPELLIDIGANIGMYDYCLSQHKALVEPPAAGVRSGNGAARLLSGLCKLRHPSAKEAASLPTSFMRPSLEADGHTEMAQTARRLLMDMTVLLANMDDDLAQAEARWAARAAS